MGYERVQVVLFILTLRLGNNFPDDADADDPTYFQYS